MTFVPLHVQGKCVMDDETLFTHMENAIARGLPELLEQSPPREGVVALVASGPSVSTQLSVIRKMKGTIPIVAIKDAHDWLIGNGVIPDYAVAIDPQEHRWDCFKAKSKDVQYLIASQCHKAMFDHLEGCDVTIWHPYITKDQKRPKNRPVVIGGGTTSGLRAIALFYVLGYRNFALFGFDSCLENGVLRVNGDKPKEGALEVRCGDRVFQCNPSMALQAQHFQKYFDVIPDANYTAYGDGLIPEILRLREKQIEEMRRIRENKPEPNGRVSFIHKGGPDMASYRYRASIPSGELGWSINDLDADTLIFAKPTPEELWEMGKAKARGATVIVDFCDAHFDWMHYQEALRLADVVTCPTETMRAIIHTHDLDKEVHVVADPYEYPEMQPHCSGTNLLWYGHQVNRTSLQRILPDLEGYPLRVVSNFQGSVPWSWRRMLAEFAEADIVVIPATDLYKSCNRAIEATRQGCFVVAEEHPSLKDFPGIWIGNIKEGIEWARNHPQEARQRTLLAQDHVKATFAPRIVASAWKKAIPLRLTSGLEKSTGTDG